MSNMELARRWILNKVMLMGRICKDLEIKIVGNQMSFLSFTVAVNQKYTKPGEEKKTDFLNCKAFSKTAENIAKFFRKGSLIIVSGRIQTGSYEKDGQKIYTTDIMVDEFEFTGEKKDESHQVTVSTTGYRHELSVSVEPDLSGDDELPF